MKASTKLICALIIFMLTMSILDCANAGDTRIGYMPASHHFVDSCWDESKDCNESHNGLVIERRINPEGDWVGVMHYTNSIENDSWTAYGINDKFFGDSKHLSAGLVYGAVTGYDFPVIPYVLPTVSIKAGEHLKVRTIVFPLGAAAQLMLEF